MEHMQVGFPRVAGVKWVKEWVPQETILNNGKCYILKWVSEDTLKTLKEKHQEKEPEPEPVTPRIFLCSYEGCGKTFTEGGALRKHSHVHGEKQHVCHYEGCGKKFLDSSKLKRHFLIHTGEKHFVCPHEGCGKAFSLDFNLRAHMRTHSQENYHICPFEECGKRYAHEYKLKAHIKSTHEKNLAHAVKLTPPQAEREFVNPKVSIPAYGTVTSDRPFICPYEGCDKCYIHEYKLNLHLRREHAGYAFEENGKHESESDDEMDQASDQETNVRNAGIMTGSGRGKLRVTSKTVSAANVQRKILNSGMVDLNTNTNARSFTKSKELGKGNPQEDSEETKEDQDDTDNEGWGHGTETDDDDEDEDDDEETEDDMD
ncbi:hypothetical protein SUGI_0831220 [Cryptomeria japonica]|uniref:zinc finger transcription factor YY1 isoform X2 n=1 Tax=Cryptomeria japonica TaxID=3369 RepID=UPI002414BD2A|nr:zinc finger transcription factor YY1 isoform X2 [Cryptomeria japonica]GLJ40384.1 hypothetical protein SUGI_0831220 [Cryptomeria japonica]